MTEEVTLEEALDIINQEYEATSASISFRENAVILSGRLKDVETVVRQKMDDSEITIIDDGDDVPEPRIEIETDDEKYICYTEDKFEIGVIGLFTPDEKVI